MNKMIHVVLAVLLTGFAAGCSDDGAESYTKAYLDVTVEYTGGNTGAIVLAIYDDAAMGDENRIGIARLSTLSETYTFTINYDARQTVYLNAWLDEEGVGDTGYMQASGGESYEGYNDKTWGVNGDAISLTAEGTETVSMSFADGNTVPL